MPLKKPKTHQVLSNFFRALEAAARTWPVGAVLALGGMGFAISMWEAPSPDLLNDRWPLYIGAAGLTYMAGLVWLARASTRTFALAPAAAAGQLLKYVPGAFWQLQPLVAADSLGAAGRVVVATVLSAAVPLIASGLRIAAGVGAGILLVTVFLSYRRWGLLQAAQLVAFGLLSAVLISLSGGLVGAAVDEGVLEWSRRVGTAWGVGVLVAPVPAGLGIREAVLAAIAPGSDAVLVAAFHRAITIVVDVGVGGAAWLWVRRRYATTTGN